MYLKLPVFSIKSTITTSNSMSYALKRAKHKHKAARKIAHINELKFAVPVTAKCPGKVSFILKNIYITKLYCLIYLA